MKKLLFPSLFIALLFASCKETKTEETDGGIRFAFTEPQPQHDSELDHFPARFTGVYTAKDSTVLTIDRQRVVYERNYKLPIAKNALDSLKSEGNYQKGKFTTNDGKVYNAVETADSVYIYYTTRDTIFRLSGNNKIKRINGHLILNEKDSVFWRTSILSIENDSLKWRRLFRYNEVAELQKLVKDVVIGDTTIIRINPTLKEFKNIIAQKRLGSKTVYKKIK
jgi:hypothetical protein